MAEASTILATQLLADTMDAFKVRVPLLSAISTDFVAAPGVKGQVVSARIAKLPTLGTYSTSYANNETEWEDTWTDVPVTLSNHHHVTVKTDHLVAIGSTNRGAYEHQVNNMAHVLADDAMDTLWNLVVAANFSLSETYSHANSDYDMLAAVRKKLNANGAAPMGRFGIVNSDVANTLDTDSRMTSRDYAGQQAEADGYIRFRNVGGFESIFEWPSADANSENLSSFFGTRESLIMVQRVPRGLAEAPEALQRISNIESLTDPDTGLTFTLYEWADAATGDVKTTITHLFGVAAGMQGGSAGEKADYAGCRVVTA